MLTQIGRRRILIAALAGAGFAALGITVASSHATSPDSTTATSGTPVELPMSNLNTPAGYTERLKAGVSYQASAFPIPLRVTPPDGTWGGAQWKTSSHGKPAFGWAALAHGPVSKPPRGLIEMLTAFGPTPPVAAILDRLRSAGGGATFEKTTRTSLAGLLGWEIDGKVFGQFGHGFVPFTPKTGGASPPDDYKLEPGEAFRIIVLDVRGKRVVLILDSAALPADQFPAFLTSANRLLKTLKFPA